MLESEGTKAILNHAAEAIEARKEVYDNIANLELENKENRYST